MKTPSRRELFSAVMDKMGLLRQFLPPAIAPLDRSMAVPFKGRVQGSGSRVQKAPSAEP